LRIVGGMDPNWNPKKPGETVLYTVNWADIYPDVISTFTITVTSGTVTIANSDNDPRLVYAWVQGGANGETATIKCEIVTNGGQTLDRTATLPISSTGDSLNPDSTLTKGALFIRALGKLGIANYVFDTEAEEDVSGLRQMDSLASDWQSKLDNFGYSQPSVRGNSLPTDPSGINASDEDAFIYNLAVLLAPDYGKQPSPIVLKRAADMRSTVFTRYAKQIEVPLTDKMPVGAGNRFWYRNRFPSVA
jgi:hypothetical protein